MMMMMMTIFGLLGTTIGPFTKYTPSLMREENNNNITVIQ